MSRSRTAALLVVAIVLLLAACGGDDEGSGDEKKSSTTSTTAPTGPTLPDPADDPETVAEAMNLSTTDFMEDWTATDSPEGTVEQLEACFTSVEVADVAGAGVAGSRFTRKETPGDQVISSVAFVVEDVPSAEAMVAEVADEAFATCARDVLVAGFESDGVVVQEATLAPVDDAPDLGEEASALRGAITIDGPAGDAPTEGELGFTVLRTKTVVSAVWVVDVGGDNEFQALFEDSASAVNVKHGMVP